MAKTTRAYFIKASIMSHETFVEETEQDAINHARSSFATYLRDLDRDLMLEDAIDITVIESEIVDEDG